MREEIGHSAYEELAGAYALDAVEPDEAASFESHLAGCPRCRSEVDAYRELAAGLATAALLENQEPPSPAVWDRIAGHVATVPRPSALGPGEFSPGVAFRSASRRSPRRPTRWGAMAMAMAAAAVVAIVVLGLNLSTVDGQLGRAQRAIDSHGASAVVQAALAEPNHHLVRLDSSEGAQVAEFVVTASGNGYLVHSSMPALPSDETYQLWAIVSGQAISMGLMGAHPTAASFTLAPSAAAAELAVTVEPAGGVTTPDRAPVATGRFA